MLVQSAAQTWKADPAGIRTDNGEAIHDASGRRLAYRALIPRAQALMPPKDPPLKDPKDFKLIGKPLKRLDTPGKVNGQVVYGIDAMLPGMKFATIAACPVFGGKVAHVDDAAAYKMPFLAHATMEPMNCTVQPKPDSCEIWIGTQVITRVQQTVAKLTGLPEAKVTVHNHLIGGGFGRRLEPDIALSAVRVAQHWDGSPLKVVWSREEDIQHDIYRPCYRDVISASLVDGKVSAFKYKVCGSSVMACWLPPAFQKGIDIDSVDSAVDMPYDVPHFQVQYLRVEPPAVTTGFWRGVGPNNNVFAIECFMDDCAKKIGKDPIAFRRDMLQKTPRLKAALDLAAEKSGWRKPLPARVGRGVSAQPSFGSFLATVVEAEVDTQGEVTIKNGRVQQSNFHDYRMLRIDQTPAFEVHLIKNGEPPGGIGETGTTAAVPALRNAIYAATGIALRRMPIDRNVLAGRTPIASA